MSGDHTDSDFEPKLEGKQRNRDMEARWDADFSYWGRKEEWVGRKKTGRKWGREGGRKKGETGGGRERRGESLWIVE